MVNKVKLEPAWSEAWHKLAARFGVKNEVTLAVIVNASLDALQRTVGPLSTPIRRDNELGLMLRRRCIKGLAIKAAKEIAASKQEMSATTRAFAIAEVRRRMVLETGGPSGDWFDPVDTEFPSPPEFGDDAPNSYRLCLLECVTAVICEQNQYFAEKQIKEYGIAHDVRNSRLRHSGATRLEVPAAKPSALKQVAAKRNEQAPAAAPPAEAEAAPGQPAAAEAAED